MKKKIRKIMNISGKEKCDICGIESFLEGHHIEGREIDNANKSYNIANICANCHSKIHMGSIFIEGWFMTTNGKELIWHEAKQESITGEIKVPYQIIKK